MDHDFINNLLVVLFFILLSFGAIAKFFFRIFVKPFIPPSDTPEGQAKRREVKEFLDELRRDLGHGDLPPPRSDTILEERPRPPIPPIRRQPPRPVQRARPPLARQAPRRAPEAPLDVQRPGVQSRTMPVMPSVPPPMVTRKDPFGINQFLNEDAQRAMILSEILGPPRAHRRRGRGRI